MTLEEFFGEDVLARRLFDAVSLAVGRLGKASIRVTKSQIAFRRRKNVAVVWMPSKYLKPPVAPLVLALSLARKDRSRRWKQVTQVTPHRFTHHLELHQVEDVNAEVRGWLRAAWEAAA
jgi:hypothetical protein